MASSFFRRTAQRMLRPVMRAVYGYESAGGGRRFGAIGATSAGVNTLIAGAGDTIRAQARHMDRANAFGRSAVNAWVANVIGTGIVPQPQHPDPAERALLKREWERFMNHCDLDGATNGYGLQAMVARETYVAGDCFVRRVKLDLSAGERIPLKIQVIEGEHVPYAQVSGAAEGNQIRCGVEFDALNRRVAYHVYRQHPGEHTYGAHTGEIDRVLASEIAPQFVPLRAGQIRGETAFAPVLTKLLEFDQYDDAELLRKKLVTMLIGWVKKPEGVDALPTTTEANGEVAPAGVGFTELQPGSVMNLPMDGTDMGWHSPSDVGGSYQEFHRVQGHLLAAGLQLAYEQLTGDMDGATYSSVRSRLIEVRRLFEQYQYNVFEFQFCRVVWKWFIEAAVLAGVISARKYIADSLAYEDVVWRPQAWPWVDPLKDANAEVLAIRNGLKSRTAAVNERGEDAEEVDRQQAADNARADQLGLGYDSDGRKRAAGATNFVPDDETAPPPTGRGKGKELVQ